ncbi:TPA: LPXTG cell wall anchor domain-containing protein [Enterococcus faecalis]|uniref:LPXTG cell wall anchor domain-containing protein n=1 Tax=Enterococcus faecalis TaxID=1351 RepID=UPI003B229A29|nr:LPXTG cell wall anchor domain-containing protein [Enterococcus faecalis]
MKKIILSSLFSTTVLLGMVGTSAYADTTSPGDPSVPPTEILPPTEETPEEPVLPPTDGGTEIPEVPENPDTGGGTETPEVPENPDTGGGTETPEVPENPDTGGGTETPEVPENPDTGGGTETPEVPENPGNGGNEGNTTPPTTPPTNNGGTNTTPPTQDVVVTPDGSIGNQQTGGQTVQIETNNASELTHIPTPSTPIETATGEKIVSVVDGVAYKESENGLTPISDKVEQLPSGNIAVKGSDGKMKVLPKTGSEQTVLMTVLGGLLTLGTGVVWWKKRM